MRIVAGQNRGLALAGPPAGDDRIRPTADRVRESLFNLLASSHGNPVPGARVIDLFAGTGALGLEALSRGAAFAMFVDDRPAALTLIRQNVGRARAGALTRIWRRDATRLGPVPEGAFDLAFLDPPYGRDLGRGALAALRAGDWLARDALVLWEAEAPQDPPEGYALVDHRAYGDTHVTVLRPGDRAPDPG
jgi:16S rRNA (guanine966-N2)-methyltransferase